MTPHAWTLLIAYVAILILLAWPLGGYIASVLEGRRHLLSWLSPVERLCYRVAGVRPDQEMTWRRYALAALAFNAVGLLVVYGLQRLQAWLPLNPQHLGAITPDSSFNTAVSFATNTNWQGYGGESTMSYLTQMLGLAVQNFVSAASGIAVMAAVIRGIARRTSADARQLLGRPGAEHGVRPAPAVARARGGAGLAGRGPELRALPDGRAGRAAPRRRQARAVTEQLLPMGPAASQVAIKQLGTNGGGFFNVNSAHPFENPTPLSNFLELLAILIISAALCITFGRMVGDRAPGLGAARGDDRDLPAGRHPVHVARAPAQPPVRLDGGRRGPERDPARRQHGGQGGALRPRGVGAVGDGHHRRLERVGQLDARLVHAARRH